MRHCLSRPARMATILAAGLLVMAAGTPRARAAVQVSVTANAKVIPAYDVFELSFTHENNYAHPFFDVTIDLVFRSPTGKSYKVGGFYYGSSEKPRIEVRQQANGRKQITYHFTKHNLWKARFAPNEEGNWTYSYVFTVPGGDKATGQGQFTCIRGRRPNPGFIRINPNNPYRFVFDNGQPFYPVGLQDGVFDNAGLGTVLANWAIEGPFRENRQGFPKPPPGAAFMPGPSNDPVNADVYFRRYSECGFNVFRFSQRNFSLDLYRDLDHYYVQQAIMVDELLRFCRKYHMHIFYGIFGYMPVFTEHPENAEGMAKVKRFIKYSVDRWGAYVDFWELLNEQKAKTEWYDITVPYLHSVDPYHHPLTTSWERPEIKGIDFSSPHWYQDEDQYASHSETANKARQWKRFGKPVLLGEQGNWIDRKAKNPPGVVGAWDPGSARRMRIRLWTAFFNEIGFVFWNTSYAKDGHNMNIWLGPTEREYVRALQDYCYRLDAGIKMSPLAINKTSEVRGYALASKIRAGLYLVHIKDRSKPAEGIKATFLAPKAAKGYWYSPATAEILQTVDVKAGRNTLPVPAFKVDIALLATSAGPPDIDHDGLANNVDPDNDNDGVPNAKDAFPLDPSEWADADKDGIGDNADADINADGKGDDLNHNGIPDYKEPDIDGDGYPKANAVPWDAFPWNPKEWRDTDGDGIGDNADTDDDNDGYSDQEEIRAGTDPLNPLSFPWPPPAGHSGSAQAAGSQ